jgi:hypothetical protein
MNGDSVAVPLPGGRDARGTLDRAADDDGRGNEPRREREDRGAHEAAGAAATDAEGRACVVACPPHPRQRGRRGDERLRAVSRALTARGVDCLRFDYGPWDEGRGERADARNAVAWARERYARVGCFGYSFGGGVALCAAAAAARAGRPVAAVSALAPVARLPDGSDVAAAVAALDPGTLQVVSGVRDDTVDSTPVVRAARAAGATVDEPDADHLFVGQGPRVGDVVGGFLADRLADRT